MADPRNDYETFARIVAGRCPELSTRAEELRKHYESERLRRQQAEWDLKRARSEAERWQRKARNAKAVPPIVHDDDPPECGECWDELDPSWTFCPGCGCWLDWDGAHPPEPDWDYLYDCHRDMEMEEAWAKGGAA